MASKATAKVIIQKSNGNEFLNQSILSALSLPDALGLGRSGGTFWQQVAAPNCPLSRWGVNSCVGPVFPVHPCTSFSPFFLSPSSAQVDPHSRIGPSRLVRKARGGRFLSLGQQPYRLQRSTSWLGRTQPPDAGLRGGPGGPEGPSLWARGHNVDHAAPEGLSLWTRCLRGERGGPAAFSGWAWGRWDDQLAQLDIAGSLRTTRWPGGTYRVGAGPPGRPGGLVGLTL